LTTSVGARLLLSYLREPGADALTVAKLTIDGRTVRSRQRLHAAVTLVVPFAGFIAAVVGAVAHGVRALEVSLLVAMYTISMAGVDIGYHRLFAHRSFKAGSALRAVLAIFGSTAAQGPVLYWATNHRLHHATSDTATDLHSPHVDEKGRRSGRLRGLWHAHVGWQFAHEPANPIRLAKDLMRDMTLMRINELYFAWIILGLALPVGIGALAAGLHGVWAGLIWGGLLRIFLVQHATFAGNSICHMFGSRPFDTKDWSTNNLLLVLPTFGGAMHNTHHAFPSSAVVGLRWWHFDLGGWSIRALAAIGLASDVRLPPPAAVSGAVVDAVEKG
jgi:stearoyl-CoA desaturase (Delta-9 desaturase)